MWIWTSLVMIESNKDGLTDRPTKKREELRHSIPREALQHS